MDTSAQQKRWATLFHAATVVAAVSFVAVVALIGLQAYVRWAINQNFTLLGGFELEALTLATFALIFGLVVLARPRGPGA